MSADGVEMEFTAYACAYQSLGEKKAVFYGDGIIGDGVPQEGFGGVGGYLFFQGYLFTHCFVLGFFGQKFVYGAGVGFFAAGDNRVGQDLTVGFYILRGEVKCFADEAFVPEYTQAGG